MSRRQFDRRRPRYWSGWTRPHGGEEGYASYLCGALTTLAPQLKDDQAERGADLIVELMGQRKKGSAWGDVKLFVSALTALAGRVQGQQAERLANRIVELMSKADGSNAATLGESLAALAPQLKSDQAKRLVNRIVAGTSQDQDPDVLRAFASALSNFPYSLSKNDIPPALKALDLPDAPCAVVLAFDRISQPPELIKQLRNPLCHEDDSSKLALLAAQISGQPLAQERKFTAGEETVVAFPALSAYLSSQDKSYNRFKVSLSELAALVLVVGALVTFVLAPVKPRGRGSWAIRK